MRNVKEFEFATSQDAWEGLNEWFFQNEKKIVDKIGGRYGNQLAVYDVFCKIKKTWVNPEIDFGYLFGYRIQKWTGLVNNYVNMNYLDILKSQVQTKETKTYPIYNISMPFDNSHGHGKNCLLSLTCSRRAGVDEPIITFVLRSSEITKRLIIDFLLIHRIAEYIYGENQSCIIHFYGINVYQNVESFVMYDLHKSLDEINKNKRGESKYTDQVLDKLHEFKNVDAKTIKYKVFLRSVNQLQKLSKYKEMKAKSLFLDKKRQKE